MFRLNFITWLTRKPLIALAMLALTAVAGMSATAGARPADAASAYLVRVTFNTVTFNNIDDCEGVWPVLFNCDQAEVYGKIGARFNSSAFVYRDIGASTTPCESDWATGIANGPCAKRVTDKTFRFADTPMCFEGSGTTDCSAGSATWKVNTNVVVLLVQPGQSISIDVQLKDYDPTIFDADDTICSITKNLGTFSDAQLQTLNQPFSGTFNTQGDGGCTISGTLTATPF
jgi:hypothetical protein